MFWIEIAGSVATIIAVIGVVLNNRRSRACFYLWFVSNAMTLAIHFNAGLYSLAFKDAVFFALAVHGLVLWSRPTSQLGAK